MSEYEDLIEEFNECCRSRDYDSTHLFCIAFEAIEAIKKLVEERNAEAEDGNFWMNMFFELHAQNAKLKEDYNRATSKH